MASVIDELRLKPLPIVLIGDFNAHHPYWHGENGNKLGNELFEYLSDKDLSVMNSAQPTRKDKIIDLRFLSTLWPILQLIAHHIQDKLAVSFDSSSIGLISYKCFLTIDAKYSSLKAYNEENSFF